MTKFLKILLLCTFPTSAVYAEEIPETQAREIATAFLNKHLPAAAPSADAVPSLDLTQTFRSERDGRPMIYVFQRGEDEGFVIVSADDRTIRPVLGYSDAGTFRADETHPNAWHFMQSYVQQMENFEVKAPQAKADAALPASVQPLLKTKWNQLAPYNDYCPTLDEVRCPTGCVATAMAQVMYYHRWPLQGRGTYSYFWTKGNTTLSADFSQSEYRWDLMLPEYDATADAEAKHQVAQLMSDVGIAFAMNYEPAGSGTSVSREAMIEFFDYDASINHLERKYCSNSQWENLLRNELAAGRPVLYAGGSGSGAHEFVCDGYDANGYFHFNMGWGGQSDGYYLTTATGYDLYQNVFFNIRKNEGNSESLVAYQTTDFKYDDQQQALTAKINVNYSLPDEVELAVKVEDWNGMAVRYDGTCNYKGDCSFTIGDGLEDGEYRLLPVARMKGSEEWTEIFYPELRQGEVNLSVSNGNYEFSNLNLHDEVRAGAVEIDGLCYELNKTLKKATVTYRNENYDFYVGKKNIEIPEKTEYNGVTYNVRAIGQEAFNGTDAEVITLPASITDIAMGGLGAQSLRRVAIPADSKLKKIDGWGLNGAIHLNAIRLPQTLQQIGMCGFQSVRLAALVLPKKCTNLGKTAFNCNANLQNVYVSYTSKPKVDNPFQYCDNLNTLYVPIGQGDSYRNDAQWSEGFKEVKEYTELNMEGVRYACCPADHTAVPYMADQEIEGHVFIPGTVELEGESYSVGRIEAGAFEGVSAMTSMATASGITSIGEGAFMGCKALREAVIANDVATIGTDAFYDCPALETVYCTGQRPAKIEDDTFQPATYAHATLYVPEGCSETYKAMKGWQRFNCIVEFDPSGITPALSEPDNGHVDVYSPQGICLRRQTKAAGATDGLPRGIYLIHYGTHTENILVE